MNTKQSALIGNPTDHSVSDIMFHALINNTELQYTYQHNKMSVATSEIKNTLEMLVKKNYVGLNVTLPYKRLVMEYVNKLDSTAADIGAVNTIKINSGDLIGYNTDWIGLYKPIVIHSQKDNPTICIFGTGGASRAAIYAAKKISDDVYVLYRDYPKVSHATQDLFNKQKELGISLLPYVDVKDIVDKSDIIIHTTSTGMKGSETETPFNIDTLQDVNLKGKLFIDAVFNPVKTTLLQFFFNNGAKTIDGLWMMIYQGIFALSIWLDEPMHIKNSDLIKIHRLLKETISCERN
ncbi:shikimate dehydrogenase [Bacillus thuringiensis]|uniref:shikimate dehydrogenase family protein n=1 Tax=Bacillus thuringiensis TaxID=1428 RepID=UPI000E4AFAC6|nr:shikimate dehydrogenase [Bacillus thuringiensis]MDZ3952324.1 shikimate dehydrogenase [Bacillus thuringiensis]RGP43733.1 shikimate dehydrogenase [Bacillus thuringiensis]